MTKDELIFCINCAKSIFPGIFSDTPEKVQKLLMDVYEEDIKLSDIEELFNERIIEEDEYDIMYRNYGYC